MEKEDTGWFTCQASNGHSQPVKAKAYLDVQCRNCSTVQYFAKLQNCCIVSDRPEVLPSTPAIQYIPVGLAAQLTCNIDANPPASYVKWSKNGKLLTFDKFDQRSATVSRRLAALTLKKVWKSLAIKLLFLAYCRFFRCLLKILAHTRAKRTTQLVKAMCMRCMLLWQVLQCICMYIIITIAAFLLHCRTT